MLTEVIEHFVHGPCVEVHRQIKTAIGEYDELLTLVKRRKLRWFGHVSRSSDLVENPKGHSERKRKKRQTEEEVGRQYQKVDEMVFASSTRAAENRTRWKGTAANSFVVPDGLPMLWDRIEL